jgi:alcohol dehydrogenase (cytochrome c)
LIYITTGNAAPDLNGIHRAGDNLYAASIVALDANTGKPQWHFQEVHHDIWDYDGPQPVVLFSLNGVPALSHCQKSGEVYILDRRNGRPLHAVTETPVPAGPAWQHAAPTQPVSSVQPLTPRAVEFAPPGTTPAPRFTPPQPVPMLMQPGPTGGCQWPPAAYSPRTRFLYYGTSYQPAAFQTFPNNTEGFASTAPSSIPGVQARGIFGATNSLSGLVVWKHDIPEQPARSGMLVAGDLVFYGQNDGMFNAASAASGTILWSFDGTSVENGGGANAAPIAYVTGGKEFIANAFGGNSLVRRRRVSPLGDALIAFSLPDAGYTGPRIIHASR